MDDYLASLGKLIALAPRTLFPAPRPGGQERRRPSSSEYVDHRLWREERILEAWQKGTAAPAEMLADGLRRRRPAAAYPLAERQILAHLERLRRAGRITG